LSKRARKRRVRLAFSTSVIADMRNRTASNGKLSNLLRIGQRRMRHPSLVGVRPQAWVIGGICALLSYDPASNSGGARRVRTITIPACTRNPPGFGGELFLAFSRAQIKQKPHDVRRQYGLSGLVSEP